MATRNARPRDGIRDVVFDALSVGWRRRVLAVLAEAGGPVRAAELVRRTAASASGATPVPGGRYQRRRRRTLRHVHLPALANAELVTWDYSGGTVAPSDHVLYDLPDLDRVLSPDDRWNEVYRCLAAARRRWVLAILDDADDPLARSTLAAELFATDPAGGRSSESVDDVLAALHHVHLPRLDAAGLVTYDRDRRTVALIDDPWLAAVLEILWPDDRSSDPA